MSESPSFSRPTSSLIAGKQVIAKKTMVSVEVSEDFARWSRERGYATESDCMRDLILTAMYGVDHMANLHRQRLSSLFQNSSATVTPGGDE